MQQSCRHTLQSALHSAFISSLKWSPSRQYMNKAATLAWTVVTNTNTIQLVLLAGLWFWSVSNSNNLNPKLKFVHFSAALNDDIAAWDRHYGVKDKMEQTMITVVIKCVAPALHCRRCEDHPCKTCRLSMESKGRKGAATRGASMCELNAIYVIVKRCIYMYIYILGQNRTVLGIQKFPFRVKSKQYRPRIGA